MSRQLCLSTSLRRPSYSSRHVSRRVRALHEDTTTSTSTVNASEIAHFSRLSGLWWDERGQFSLLHKMNPHRVRFIRDKVVEIGCAEHGETWASARAALALQGLDVLDVGCGGGILSETLARLGGCTLAIDASEKNIAIASLHAAADPSLALPATETRGSLAYRHATAETLVQEPKRFDVVCSMEVIEHVDNPAGFLRSCAELVKPGGHLFLSTIARTPLAFALTILAAEKVLGLVEPGTHTFSKFINPSELVEFFQTDPSGSGRPWITRTHEHGLPTRTEAEVRGIWYEPWGGDWRLMPRGTTPFTAACNYLFWVRKPRE
ncbi:S-adenosyl-L-methionine-dependent methyltransferase [Vararia minispora EC-137]|uniref:S-adenosyl-L-methionine-dependent methyltransferase n=1 Tax=Vararia minispora EC-137 TaxID=1314806 RepID=A0ACB8QDY3_9AGAM|nr:S-adenosyl-L-methionine-dependent methyltransferase [Vararia minispora EC-137]